MTEREEDRIIEAGELVLRVLSPEAEARALERTRSEPEFAREVGHWNERLTGFIDEIEPVVVPDRIWSRIQTAIGGVANDNAKLVFWRNWAVGATVLLAASLGAVAFMVAQPRPVVTEIVAPTGGVTRVATLALSDGGDAVLTLAYDTATGQLYLSPTPTLAGEAGVPHLWLVLPDDGGVQLVGAFEGGRIDTRRLGGTLAGLAGQAPAMAISLEAPGVTPADDTPQGPVIASGELQSL